LKGTEIAVGEESWGQLKGALHEIFDFRFFS
jgi:hypothetical protein